MLRCALVELCLLLELSDNHSKSIIIIDCFSSIVIMQFLNHVRADREVSICVCVCVCVCVSVSVIVCVCGCMCVHPPGYKKQFT